MQEYEDYKKLLFFYLLQNSVSKAKTSENKHFQVLHTQNRAKGIGT